MPLSDEGYITEQMFRIADKEGDDVNFVLNKAQRDLDETLSGRDLVPKARQRGISAYVLARYTVKCLMKRNTRAVVISHDQESTQRMLKRVMYYLNEIRGPAPLIKNMSANEITFPKMNSMFYIGTAGSRKFGRGDTITDLHCSEYAFWSNPADLMRGLMQAVPKSGEIIIESTGNGLNDYYNRCMRAYQGDSNWKLHFYPWHTEPEYTLDIDDVEAEDVIANLDYNLEEPAIHEAFKLTPGQMAWRRMKLEEMDYDLKSFKQEYPMTLDECFQMSGQSIFHRVHYVPTDDWRELSPGLWALEGHPHRGFTYALGGDASAGVGRDSSAIEIFCLDTNEQVAEYVSNKVDPQVFAKKIYELGGEFDFPYAVVENNNHGLLTVAALERLYPAERIHTSAGGGRTEEAQLATLGHKTTSKSKPLMIGRLRSALADGLTVHSPLFNAELSTFIEHENGQMAAQDGCHDDTVMAAACALVGVNEAAMFKYGHVPETASTWVDPFSLDSILNEVEGKRGGDFPIRPQTGETVH